MCFSYGTGTTELHVRILDTVNMYSTEIDIVKKKKIGNIGMMMCVQYINIFLTTEKTSSNRMLSILNCSLKLYSSTENLKTRI